MRRLTILALCWAALLAALTDSSDFAVGLALAGLAWPLAAGTGIALAELRYPPAVRTPRMPLRFWLSRGRRAAWRAYLGHQWGDARAFTLAGRTLRGRALRHFEATYYALIGPARIEQRTVGVRRHLALGAMAKTAGRL